MDRRLVIGVAVGLFAFSLLLRLIGINWGLKNDLHNQSYHPDETFIFAVSQQIDPTALKFTPGFYNYGTLYLTALRIASDMTSAYTGGYDPKNPDSYWSWAARCNLAGRLISAFAGAGTVAVVFFLGLRVAPLFGSVFGSLLVAVAPAHVVHSRFQTVDILATFFLALSALFALRLLRNGSMRDAVLSGVFAGLSGSTKYNGILALFTLYTALALARKPDGWLKALVGSIAAIAAFVITTPGILLESAQFFRDFQYEMFHTSTGHGLVFVGTSSGFLYHLINLVVGIGPILTLLGLGGLGFAAWKRNPEVIALLAFFLIYYLLIGRAEVKFLRYTFPLYVGLGVGFGYLMAEMQRQKNWGKIVVAVGIAGIGGLDPGGGMRQSMIFTAWMAGQDPREAAARYLKQNAKVVGLASDPWFYSPPLFPDSTAPRTMKFDARMVAMDSAVAPIVRFHRTPGEDPFAFDTRLLTEDQPDFTAVSSFEYGDLDRLRGVKGLEPIDQLQVDRFQAFSAELTKSYEVAQVYGSDGAMYGATHDLEYVRPVVYLWKRKTNP